MINRLAALLLVGAVIAVAGAAGDSHTPFVAVKREGNNIVATLPETPKWLVSVEAEDMRLTKPNEAFRLRDGDSLTFFVRHISYKVQAHLAPVAGLQVELTEDTRSVGGKETKKSYFVKAQ
jgi:hypothetical protein